MLLDKAVNGYQSQPQLDFASFDITFDLYILRVADFRGVNRASRLGWIVNTTNSKIPNLSIWDSEVLPYLVRKPLFSGNCTG
jgi:hypothetical protein